MNLKKVLTTTIARLPVTLITVSPLTMVIITIFNHLRLQGGQLFMALVEQVVINFQVVILLAHHLLAHHLLAHNLQSEAQLKAPKIALSLAVKPTESQAKTVLRFSSGSA